MVGIAYIQIGRKKTKTIPNIQFYQSAIGKHECNPLKLENWKYVLSHQNKGSGLDAL